MLFSRPLRLLILVIGSPLCPFLLVAFVLKMMLLGWLLRSVLVWTFVCHTRADVESLLIALALMLLSVSIPVVKVPFMQLSMILCLGLLPLLQFQLPRKRPGLC